MGLSLDFLSCSIDLWFLFLCHYHSVLITVALYYSLKSGSLIPLAPFFFSRLLLLFMVFCVSILYDFTYMWILNNKANIHTWQNRNRFIDTENKLVVSRGEGSGGWVKLLERIKKYKLPVIKCHKDVMHSIGNIVNNIFTILYGDSW